MQLGRKLAEGYAVDIGDEPAATDVAARPEEDRVDADARVTANALPRPPIATPAQV